VTIENPFRPTGSAADARPLFGVLAECRDEVIRRVSEALERALGEIHDEVETQRQGVIDAAESVRLIDTAYRIRTLRTDFAPNFRNSFERHFARRAQPVARKSNVYDDAGTMFPELSLVDDAEISEILLVRTLAARLEAACGRELQPVQVRVAFLLGKDEIQEAANPLGPTALCEALQDVCRAVDDAGEAHGAMLDLLVARLAGDIGAIYAAVNALLVSRKVMPGVLPRVSRRLPQSVHRARRAGGPLSEAEKHTNELIRQLLSTKTADRARSAPRTGTAGGEVTALLNRLQKGEAGVPFGGDAFSLPQHPPDATNLITALLDAGLARHVGAVDALVIDVVATLFDYIFDDTRVPEPIKGLIGRLQLPVLKLAMMDHGFFSNRAHPARRLINALAQAGATWDGAVTPDTSLYRTAEATVLRVQNEFAEDVDVFARCQQDFDAYLAEQERHADERAATLTERLQQRERHELAREVAQKAIVARLANDGLPELVRRFVANTWIKVLTRTLLEGGEEGAAWREASTTLDDLVWSVLPKYDAESRRKMVQRLPALLRDVKAGMKAAAMDEGEQKQFFAELVQFHAAALKAGVAPGDAVQPAQAHSVGRGAGTAPGDEPTPGSLELDLLHRGSWVELRDESGGVRRVRLTWISPARTMYLFANRQGQRALALTRNELTRRFASGEAATASDEALLDRVVDDVLDEFQR